MGMVTGMDNMLIDFRIQGKYMVTLIEGDGIGPEISQSVKDIFTAAKVRTNQAYWINFK